MRLPLEDIVVADFTRVLAGPLCTQLLADEGARVIKVEEPAHGDETRRWGPPFHDGVSTYFLSINRNKESMTLDLRTDEGRAAADALIARADVVVDNFLPAQRERYLRVPETKIHCSITGFDPETAEAGTPGYDLLMQAGAGLMSITGESGPAKIGVALCDVLTAHYAHGAICAALVARATTGRGARLEISLLGAALASLVNVAQAALSTGNEAKRFGNAHPSIVPYQLFHASDREFAIGGGTDRHFVALCEQVLERPELARDSRFLSNAGRVTHREVLVPLLRSLFATRPAREWVERCRTANIPASLVRGVLEALRSEEARPLLARLGEFETVGYPVRFDGERLGIRSLPPQLGEHTKALLDELTDTTGKTAPDSTRTRTPGERR
jgi:crotonobetainyl-CoA:carnitine CoA-transferase CaiB-like acyl-CoA transferase